MFSKRSSPCFDNFNKTDSEKHGEILQTNYLRMYQVKFVEDSRP